MNYLYPKSNFSNGVYTTYKINESKIENIKNNLKKITNQEANVVQQIEYIYRDLVHVEIGCGTQEKNLYCKRTLFVKYNNDSKNLHIIYNLKPISEFNFPNLNKYHHIDKKEIHQYGDIMLIKYDTYWTICIKYDTKESIQKIYDQVVKLI